MLYFKKIVSYFDYFEYGEKKRNCGYCKLLIRDQDVTIDLHIKDAGKKESGMCDIYASGEKSGHLGRLLLDKGTGYYNASFYGGDMDGDGLCIFEVTRLQIRINENKSCETTWKWENIPEGLFAQERVTKIEETLEKKVEKIALEEEKKVIPETALEDEGDAVIETPSKEEKDAVIKTLSKEERDAIIKIPSKKEKDAVVEIPLKEKMDGAADLGQMETAERKKCIKPQETEPTNEVKQESHAEAQNNMPKREPEKRKNIELIYATEKKSVALEETKLEEILHEDKWKQLCSQYPVCYPFEDGEAYITISPKDFVILRKEYQNLVSNSFLLHSFYNYHHVILGKTGADNNEIFYIGVPGVYLEREKKVAVMFGFEGFAMSVRGNKKAMPGRERSTVEPGAFGYYMRKVEI